MTSLYRNRDQVLVKCQPYKRLNLVFPHIGKNLYEKWGSVQLSQYIQHLFTDTRGGTRKGFPKAALQDLYKLLEYHERMFGEIIEKISLEDTKPADIWATTRRG